MVARGGGVVVAPVPHPASSIDPQTAAVRILGMRRIPVALALAVAAAAAVPATAATTKSVTLKNIDISKKTVSIHRGDSVRWLFRDAPTPHNVTSSGAKRFKSSSSMTSGSYTVKFTKAGTYRYHCTIHPSMQGKVVVS